MRCGLPDGLGSAAHAYLDAFPKGDVVAFPIHPLDRLGLPVWVVALFPEDRALAGIMPYGVGYGATDEAAVLGGLGEIAEMVWPTLTLGAREKTRGSYRALARALGARAVADPFTLCLPAGSPVDHDTELEWVAAKRWADDSIVLVPIDLAAYSSKELTPGYRPFTTIISNGMGAGPDLDWAVGHGLCEILQRDGNGVLFRALDRGVTLDLADADLVASTRAILDRFAAAGIRAMPKFAADQFGLPNLYCVGVDTHAPPAAPIMVTACGEACHADRTAALEKSLTEYAASRARKAFAHGPADLVAQVAPEGYVARFMAQAGGAAKSSDTRAFDAMRDWSARDASELRGWLAGNMLSERSSHRFADLPTQPAPDGHARARTARAAVEAAGFDVLYVDMSPPDRAVTVVKVIVPGMEVETMSYYRIGARNTEKLLALGSPLIRFGQEEGAALRRIRLSPADAERLGHPLFDTAAADRLVGPLYPLYREPEAHHVRWAEARA
ncbi:ribosomal protein S12 methylthiotransferase accessory factor [Sphingomonas sp. BE138]|uniref:YcaO-like family protein n=1 Tax=Sphingomonas sp. BE138 TaxID=2817845 RepID=UPI00285FC91F|nr:YcaO-like family protein [Sphingomonas sp. BE138]MDR6787705.1 ribosomal protein S12 methylthiotransferase accessory factor [Sphingomonas sp. BE138]